MDIERERRVIDICLGAGRLNEAQRRDFIRTETDGDHELEARGQRLEHLSRSEFVQLLSDLDAVD